MANNVPTAFDQLAMVVWRQDAPVGTPTQDLTPYEKQRAAAVNLIGGAGVSYDPVNDQVVVDLSGVGGGGQTNLTLANGLNSNIATGGLRTLRVGGPTAAFAVGGFTAGAAGASILLKNTTTQPMTIVHEDLGSTAANRIDTQSFGSDITMQAKGGSCLFLYDTTSSRWIAQNIGIARPKKFDIRDFGANTASSGATNASAILLAMASAALSGGTVYVPSDGVYTVTPSGAIALPLGVKLRGERGYGASTSFGSILDFTAFGLQLGYVFSDVEHLCIATGASAGPAIDIVNTNNPSNIHINKVDILHGNPGVPLLRVGGTGSGGDIAPAFLIGSKFERCRWQHATGATVPGVKMVGTSGTLNNLKFEKIWFQSDLTATAPCFDIEGQSPSPGGSGAFNIEMNAVLFERPSGGAVKWRSVSRSQMHGCWIGDLADAQTAHLIDIGQDTVAAHSPAAANILITGLQSDSGNATHQTIFFDGTVSGQGLVVLIGCNAPHVGNNGPGANPFYAVGCNIGGFSGDQPLGWDGATSWLGSASATKVVSTGDVEANSSGEAIVLTGFQGSAATIWAAYCGANAAARSSSNPSLFGTDANTFVNGIGAGGKAGLTVAGNGWFTAYGADNEGDATNASAKPLVGDSARNSPYGQDGYATQSMQAGGTIVAAAGVYKNGTIELTGNPGGAVVLQLPLGKYRKLIDNQLSGTTVTVKGPSGTASGNLNAGTNWVWCDGTNFHGP